VAHLRPRTNVIGAATRVRHTLAKAIHRYFDENGFFWVNTPVITASDAEGAGALFRVSSLDLANLPRIPEGKVDFAQEFFGREAFLTVSGQLNVEAYCLALTKVYTFGPTFPCRELEHQPPPRRVLDDRTGDRLRRPLGLSGLSQGRSMATWESSCDNAQHRGLAADTRQPPRGRR
jgi:hypothetical protein